MQLSLQDFPALVRTQAAAAGRAASTLVDLSVGSVLRAVLEANASVALWMQWLIMEVLSTTRAATSQGGDLDSWVADFGLSRLQAVPAAVGVRFSRVTPGLATVVPVGAVVRTGAGPDGQAFAVVADASRPEWTGAGYALAADAAAVVVPARAVIGGRGGNVQAGVLRLLSTAVPGVDQVINDFAAAGGADAETDAALRARFGGFLDSRTRATAQAVTFAVQSVQQGLQFKVEDRLAADGSVRAGHFTVVLDDGSGAPSDALIQAVGSAIEAVRPVGGSYSVRRPQLVGVDVVLHVQGSAEAAARVRAAIGAYVGLLGIGTGVTLSRLIQVAHEADALIGSVWGVTINGLAADLVVPPYGRAMPGAVVVLS